MVGSIGAVSTDLNWIEPAGKVERLPEELDPKEIVAPLEIENEVCVNGEDEEGTKVNGFGGRKNVREIVLGRNIHTTCHAVTEPDTDDEVTGEREAYMASVLARYRKSLVERTKHHLGYPYNLDFDYGALSQLQHFSINNLGDPFIESNYGVHSRQFEVGVLDWFARLWELEKNEYWGYITNCGTEGNLHGILVGREVFPDGILYASRESHYSVFKAARMYRMDCVKVDTLISGEIDCADFKTKLIQNGHKREERAAIFADTRAEWLIALQGCLRRNITVVTIYASLGEEALAHSLNETEVSTVICGLKELKKLVNISGQLDTVKRVIYIEDEGGPADVSLGERNTSWEIIPFQEVERLGQENPLDADLPVSADVAVIMYTSGSTGLPKGVMMTHGNIIAVVSAVMTIVPGLGSKDIYLAYLPLAHVLELAAEAVIVAVGSAIGYGSPLTLTDTSSKIKKGTQGDASMLGPTLMTAVPAILDRVRDGVRKKVDAKGGISKTLFDIAYSRRLSAMNGSWFGAWGLERLLWNFLVFRKVRAILGGHIRFLLSGGAPLSGDTQRFINICLGAPIGQGYGLTETCAGGTFSEYDDTSVGRVGAPLPCSFIKLIDWPEGGYLTSDSPMPRGEIVIGGPNVTVGYFKNKEKTNEVYKVDERGMRWFYTGDIGRFHSDGCLEIIDRKKDIVKLQHGEYVSLGKVEAALIVSPYVDNIMLHADPFHSYCVALVVPSPQALEDWALKQGVTFTDFSNLCQKEESIKEVHNSLVKAARNARLEKFEIPMKIKLLPDPWTPESGLVTAALKLKREVIRKTFSEDLSNFYV